MQLNKKTLTGLAALGGVAVLGVPRIASATVSDLDAADEMPWIVEDYSYPGAAEIEATRGIKLIKGDGGIVLADCDGDTDLISVESIGREWFCFQARRDNGWLSLRLDRVFLIGAGGQDVSAKVVANGTEQDVQIPEGELRPIGIGDPNYGVLLELRTTP